jgi:hypothetical protein
MGQCATAEKEQVPHTDQSPVPGPLKDSAAKPPAAAANTAPPPAATSQPAANNAHHPSTSANGSDSDKEFCDTVQLVSLLIADRLVDVLTEHRDGYAKVAAKLGKSSYLDIMAPHYYEKFIRDLFNISAREPDIPKSDPSYAAAKLKLAISDAQGGNTQHTLTTEHGHKRSTRESIRSSRSALFRSSVCVLSFWPSRVFSAVSRGQGGARDGGEAVSGGDKSDTKRVVACGECMRYPCAANTSAVFRAVDGVCRNRRAGSSSCQNL